MLPEPTSNFLADEFARRGQTRFASVEFSPISRKRNDPRMHLPVNQIERHSDVDCLLWSSAFHPVALPQVARSIERVSFAVYDELASHLLLDWIDTAATIVIEPSPLWCLRFPEVMFHVIGAGPTAEGLSALLPAVCPGLQRVAERSGSLTIPLTSPTIQPAIAARVNRGKGPRGAVPSWRDVVDQMVSDS